MDKLFHSSRIVQDTELVETIAHGDDIIRLTHRGHVAHGNPLDIQYSFGVHLYLLLTKDEAAKIMSVASLRRSPVPSISHLPMFFDKLPRELRDRIYDYVFPQQYWSLDEDVSGFTDLDLLGSVSDCSGFYFPLAPKSGILAVNQQMREEALPWAYRSTSFELNDVDNVVKLLLGIGKIGRENIKILAFGWQSNCETDFEWDEAPGKVTVECTRNEDLLLTLPVIHVDTCMKLLKQCVGLTHLRLNFEKELIDFIEPEAFKANAGIRELSSLRGLREVDFWSLDQEPLDNKEAPIKWLKERLESPVS